MDMNLHWHESTNGSWKKKHGNLESEGFVCPPSKIRQFACTQPWIRLSANEALEGEAFDVAETTTANARLANRQVTERQKWTLSWVFINGYFFSIFCNGDVNNVFSFLHENVIKDSALSILDSVSFILFADLSPLLRTWTHECVHISTCAFVEFARVSASARVFVYACAVFECVCEYLLLVVGMKILVAWKWLIDLDLTPPHQLNKQGLGVTRCLGRLEGVCFSVW